MKKFIAVILFIINVFCLSACEGIASYSFEFEEEGVGVELIYYNNLDAKEITLSSIYHHIDYSEILDFDFSKMTVLETLSKDCLDDFVNETYFYELGPFVTDPPRYLDSPKGLCLRIIYQSGSFEIISHDEFYAGSFYADGSVRRFIGICLVGEKLISEYFFE